jgi:hypothetical protein
MIFKVFSKIENFFTIYHLKLRLFIFGPVHEELRELFPTPYQVYFSQTLIDDFYSSPTWFAFFLKQMKIEYFRHRILTSFFAFFFMFFNMEYFEADLAYPTDLFFLFYSLFMIVMYAFLGRYR